MAGKLAKEFIKQLNTAEEEKRSATIKIDSEILEILEKWPLGRTLKERAANLIKAGDEYLGELGSEGGIDTNN